jgi:hypothetical protein
MRSPEIPSSRTGSNAWPSVSVGRVKARSSGLSPTHEAFSGSMCHVSRLRPQREAVRQRFWFEQRRVEGDRTRTAKPPASGVARVRARSDRRVLVGAVASQLLSAALVHAQTTLGDLTQAGAQRLSPQRFDEEVVQRTLRGRLDTGMLVEMLYATSGQLQGVGRAGPAEWSVQVLGSWSAGDNGTICTRMTLDGPTIRAMLPRRCEYWFRLDERYFVSSSATDPRARVAVRTIPR